MNRYTPIAAAVALLLSGAAAHAADHGVVAKLSVVNVATHQKARRTADARRDAKPGDIVEYQITYLNTTRTPVRDVVGTLAIPDDSLSYVADSAMPGIIEVSVDGHTFAPVPLLRLVTSNDGRVRMEPIPTSQYRFLRWHVGELAPLGRMTVTARMRVEETPIVVVSNAVEP